MKKYFVMSDVHNCYFEMIHALNKAGFDLDNDGHIFVHCGDLLDRGPNPRECLEFVNNLPENRKILIKGNHEYLLEMLLERGYFKEHDLWNGALTTIQATVGCNDEETMLNDFKNDPEWIKYIKSTVNFAEVGNYVFVHGWIPCIIYPDKSFEYTENWRKYSWDQAVWQNGMALWEAGIREPNKTIVCGHWKTAYANAKYNPEYKTTYDLYKTFKNDGIIALDGSVNHTRIMNLEVLEVDE